MFQCDDNAPHEAGVSTSLLKPCLLYSNAKLSDKPALLKLYVKDFMKAVFLHACC